MGNLSKNLLLLCVSMLVSLLIFEIVARRYLTLIGDNWHDATEWNKEVWIENHENHTDVTWYPIDRYDSLYGWTLKEDLNRLRWTDWAVSSNSKGVRGREEYSYQRNGKQRILTIGDSFTFGECVADSESYPAILETLLDSTEVINLAVHGYGHDQQLLKLVHEGAKYHPDLVVLGFVNDDVNRNRVSFRDFAKPYFVLSNDTLALKGVPVLPPEHYLNAWRLKSWCLLKAKLAGLREHANDSINNVLTKKILYKINEQCQQINAKLVIVYLPWLNESVNNKPCPIALYDSLAKQTGVIAIDPTAAMHQFLSTQQHPDSSFNCHYSPQLNQVIAAEIARTVKRLNSSAVNITQP